MIILLDILKLSELLTQSNLDLIWILYLDLIWILPQLTQILFQCWHQILVQENDRTVSYLETIQIVIWIVPGSNLDLIPRSSMDLTSANSDSFSVLTPNFGTGVWSPPGKLLAWLSVLLNPDICDIDSDGFSSILAEGVTSLTVLVLVVLPMLPLFQR